jgi:hypothetical protein
VKPSQLRGVLALFALVLLVALGLLLRSAGEAADSASASEPTEFAAPVETSESTPERVTDSSEPSRTVPREEPAAEVASPTRDGLVRVRVLHHETLEPIAGAQVRWIEASDLKDPERSPFVFDPNAETRWETLGQTATCDATGEVWIAPPKGWYRMEATHADLWGRTGVSRPLLARYEILVAPQEILRVQVVDFEGQPAAGVGIAVQPAGSANAGSRPDALTGPDGIAQLSHVRGRELGGGHGPLLVRACILAAAPVQKIVDSREASAGPVRLVLPPTCSITVQLVDLAGEPWLGRAAVHVTTGAGGLFAAVRDGQAEFPHVELNRSGTANLVAIPEEGYFTGSVLLQGSAVAGDHLRLELVVNEGGLRLRGRALGPDGAPLAGTWLEVFGAGAYPASGQAGTDSNGNFSILIQATSIKPFESATILASQHGLERALDISAPLDGRLIDLGDLVLEKLPTRVAGRVVDPARRPLKGATVTGEVRERGFDASQFKPEPGFTVVEWSRDRRAIAKTDSDGRFELPQGPGDKDCRVQVALEGFQTSKPLEIPSGLREVEIVLQPTLPTIQGRVRLASHDATEHLKLRCKSATARWLPQSRGAFEIVRERAGPVDLEFFTDGESLVGETPLVRIEGIEDPNDPRLAAIDLRPLLHEFRFEVVQPPDAVLSNLRVSAALPGTMIWSFPSGPAVLVVLPASLVEGEPLLDVHLTSSYLPAKTFEQVRNGAQLKLGRSPVLLLRVPESLPAASDEAPYLIRAERPGVEHPFRWIQVGRTARLPIEQPGEWRVSWRVGNNGKELTVTTVVVDTEDVVCELDATPEVVEAEIARHKARVK